MSTIRAASQHRHLPTRLRTTARTPYASISRARLQIAERFQLTHMIRTISMGMMVDRADEA